MDYLFRRPRPRSLGLPRGRHISTPAGTRLSTIVEGAPSQPSSQHRLSNMSAEYRAHLGNPPEADAEKQPPQYNPIWHGQTPGTEISSSAQGLRWHGNRKESRGGWKRVTLIAVVILVAVVALAVGLGVGLTQHNNTSSSSSSTESSSSGSSAAPSYPIGSWSISTALKTQATNCTSISDTWSCLPYTTFAQDPTLSKTIYNWDIAAKNPSNPSNESLVISSTPTDLLLTFSNATVAFVDQGLATERFTFSIMIPKIVNPVQTLATDTSVRTICYYNQTMLTASLYTRMPQTYLNLSSSLTPLGTNTRLPWTTAAEVDFSSPGGSSVPDCYPSRNNAAGGPRITAGITAEPATSICMCGYMNYNLA